MIFKVDGGGMDKMIQSKDVDFLLGQITGQVASLNVIVQDISCRLAKQEKETLALSIKMSLLGVISGGVGSLIASFLLRHLDKIH